MAAKDILHTFVFWAAPVSHRAVCWVDEKQFECQDSFCLDSARYYTGSGCTLPVFFRLIQ